MANFGVEFVGNSPGDIESRLGQLGTNARERTNDALRETAEDVKADLEDTSPVDTGQYRDSWYIFEAAEDEVWVLNSTDYAKHVMLPNSRMQGSTKADMPSMGILHNVKGVARQHQKGLKLNMSESLQRMLKAFSIR